MSDGNNGSMRNLLSIPETHLPQEPEVVAALENLPNDFQAVQAVAAKYPASSLPWAALAGMALRAGEPVQAYAYARVGYHRGLDALRRAGWRGQGPVLWSHEPNRGVLRSFWFLREAAREIEETNEVDRLTNLLDDSDPSAASQVKAQYDK